MLSGIAEKKKNVNRYKLLYHSPDCTVGISIHTKKSMPFMADSGINGQQCHRIPSLASYFTAKTKN